MGKWLEKYAGSIRFWILVVVSVYFAYALYFAIYGLQFSLGLISDHYVYNLVSKNPWWWMVLYYGSEGVAGSVASVLRAVAGLFAFYAAFRFWRKKDNAMPAIRKPVSMALLLEAGFFLSLIPSIIAAFAYNLSSEYLFYFDHTPGLLLLYGTAIPCLAIVLVVPPLLLKLRATIKHESPREEIAKWSCLTGVAYLFVVFWFNYSMLWAGVMVPYPRAYQQYGLDFLLQPTNLLSFAVTVFGLFALAITALVSTLPAIKKQLTKLNLTRIGIVLIAFGGYFIFNILYYYLTGGYEAHPSVWYEVIGPLHNPNLWGVACVFLGLPLLIYGKMKRKG
jgi:uncharacterized membrane-anchored protein